MKYRIEYKIHELNIATFGLPYSTLGDRAFQSAAPYLWNALPSTIRNIKTLDAFQTAVKTHVFYFAFE